MYVKYAAILNLHINVSHADQGWSDLLSSRFATYSTLVFRAQLLLLPISVIGKHESV